MCLLFFHKWEPIHVNPFAYGTTITYKCIKCNSVKEKYLNFVKNLSINDLKGKDNGRA